MKINCSKCVKDLHRECENPEICLCASYDHGEKKTTIKEIINDEKLQYPKNEPLEYERQLEAEIELQDLMERESYNDVDLDWVVSEIIRLAIQTKHLVTRTMLSDFVYQWAKIKGLTDSINIPKAIDEVMEDPDITRQVLSIITKMGKDGKDLTFTNSETTETAHYLRGRYHIKRVELTGNLLFFNEQYYDPAAIQLIRRKCREFMINSRNYDVNEVLKLIEDTSELITWKTIEKSSHIKVLLNGTYDIETGEFSEKFDPDHIVLNQIPHNYDNTKSFMEIDEKVKEIISDERDKQSYYDSLSSALHPYNGIDFQFGGIGQPGTGKSQICQLSIMTLGEDNVSAAPIHLIASDMTTQKDVAFKMMNIDMDMSDDTIKNIDVLKRWITQDKFTGRGIYEHSTTFRPTARICFMANDLYEIANPENADAIYERTHIIKMDNKFRGEKQQIRNLFQKVATEDELSGFITYLLRNATDIYRNQKIHNPMAIQTTKEVWNAYGNRIKEFIERNLVESATDKVRTNDLWGRWLQFAKENKWGAKDKKKFYPIFEEITGKTSYRTSNGKYGDPDREQFFAYSGYRLTTEDERYENSPLFSELLDQKVSLQAQSSESLPSFMCVLEKKIEETNLKEKYKIVTKLGELSELIKEGMNN